MPATFEMEIDIDQNGQATTVAETPAEVVNPVAEQPTPPTSEPPTDDAEARKREKANAKAVKHFEKRLADAGAALNEASIAQLRAEEFHKAANKRYKAARDEYDGIKNRGPEILPLFDNNQPAPETEVEPAIAADAGQVNDDWRRAGIEELQRHGIKAGMTDKLVEDGITTIGQLEDLRAGAGLKSIKGIGQGKADKIEEAVLAWLSANRDAIVLAEAAATPAGESAAEDHEARAAQLDTGADNALEPTHDAPAWESGREAYEAGHTLADCPYTPNAARDDWLRGWMAGKVLAEAI